MLWCLPPSGLIKLNCDAGMLCPGVVGLGVVFRNEHGAMLASASKAVLWSWSPDVSERMAMTFGLQLALELIF